MTRRTFEARTQLPRPLLVLLVCGALIVPVGAVREASASSCPSRGVHAIRGWLHTCGTKIVDSHHHVVRPLSVSVWDMSHDNGRHPRVCRHWARPPAGAAANLGRWGFNSVLLYISWANVEPHRPTYTNGHPVHHYNGTYLRALDGVIHGFASHGVKVILAMANDRWSSAFTNINLPNHIHVACGSGMPPWLYRDGGAEAMVRAEKRFFHSSRLQRWFARAWSVVAHRYRSNSKVIGADVLHEAFDLLAQPYPGTDGLRPRALRLTSFFTRVGRAIHRANRHLLILTGDRLDWDTHRFAIRRKPRVRNAVYDFEFFAINWNSQGRNRMRAYYARAVKWHRPALVEEFFAYLPTNTSRSPSPTWATNTRSFLSYAKKHRIGWSYAPYFRLPNNPVGLLAVLKTGY